MVPSTPTALKKKVDVRVTNGTFTGLDILMQGNFAPTVDPIWEFQNGSSNCTLTGSTLSAWGSDAAGKPANYETVVIRGGSGMVVKNNTLRQAKTSNTDASYIVDGKRYFTNGQVVNQGDGSNVTTPNVVQLEP